MSDFVEALKADPLNFVDAHYDDAFKLTNTEIADIQLTGLRKRFTGLHNALPALARLAADQGVAEINAIDDVAPLLFPHTVYKSYPLSFLERGQFDRLTKWLGGLTTVDLSAVDLKGVDTTWDLSFTSILYIVGADLIGMMIGFMLGVLLRNSPGAIVAYFSYWFVIPTLTALLAANQDWFEKAQPWVDFSFNQNRMYDGSFDLTDWTQLFVTGTVWLLLPLAFGLWRVMRAEVK